MLEPERRGQETTMLWEPPCCLVSRSPAASRQHARSGPIRTEASAHVTPGRSVVVQRKAEEDSGPAGPVLSDEKPEWNQCVSVT